ncbi:hypothetical protein OEZ85_013654 [Tetradesmus obliquus]|uniref:Secreted protein n=1 Tax=Tetradesmus obliquus TaxID=3088 RepID=A0ABY8UUH2_TETOB|nr:hypothetical protein OEZ85_013654 [Tetradesmus obliquus]
MTYIRQNKASSLCLPAVFLLAALLCIFSSCAGATSHSSITGVFGTRHLLVTCGSGQRLSGTTCIDCGVGQVGNTAGTAFAQPVALAK